MSRRRYGREFGMIDATRRGRRRRSAGVIAGAAHMSLLHRQLQRRATLAASSCRATRSGTGIARGLGNSAVSSNPASQESRARPRVVFSGIQPTGTPHVRFQDQHG